MTNCYLNLGRQIYIVGTFDEKCGLPMPDIHIRNAEMYSVKDENGKEQNLDHAKVVKAQVESLQPGDTLIAEYPNPAIYSLSDDMLEAYNIPKAQREELWNSEGIVETYTYYTNADDEEWGFLVN